MRLFKEHGVEMFHTVGGTAASQFYKFSEDRNVSVGICAWFAFGTRLGAEEKNGAYFLDEA